MLSEDLLGVHQDHLVHQGPGAQDQMGTQDHLGHGEQDHGVRDQMGTQVHLAPKEALTAQKEGSMVQKEALMVLKAESKQLTFKLKVHTQRCHENLNMITNTTKLTLSLTLNLSEIFISTCCSMMDHHL